MRLHRLTASAFGPFARTVDLDVERLSDAGLFLIHGPTGSGKTSLLDAICFALYANVPGDRLATSLRSQHAPEDVPTRVELELTLAGRRLRVRRHPAHERPKRRGNGTTTEPAGVQLEELLDGEWTTLSTRIDETAHVLDDLLGMGMDQFRRVVMLPQGDFAAFLRATDEERREVLERLFDISEFTGVETHLVERRQHLEGALREDRARLAGHVAHLVELLSGTEVALPTPQTPWSELSPGDVVTALEAVLGAHATHVTRVMAAGDDARAADRAAATALEHGRRLLDLRTRGTRAHAALTELREQAPDHETRRSVLERARTAVGLIPLVEARERAEDLLRAADVERVRADAARPSGVPTGQVVPWLAEARGHDLLLTRAEHEAETMQRHVLEVPEVDAALERQAAAGADAATVLDRARAALDRSVGSVDEITRAEEFLRDRRVRLHDLTQILTTRERLHAARAALGECTDRAQSSREKSLDARERVQELVAARLDNMAGELAAQLRDGMPCSVCGATEHPRRAHTTRVVTGEEIDAAQAAAQAAETEHEQDAVERSATQSRVDLLEEAVTEQVARHLAEGGTDLGEAGCEAERQAELSSEVDDLQRVVARGATVRAEVSRHEDQVQVAEAAVGRAEAATSALASRRDQARRQIQSSGERLAVLLHEHGAGCPCAGASTADQPAERTGPATLDEDRLRDLEQRRASTTALHRAAVQAAETIVAAGRERDRCAEEVVAARERLDTALAEHGLEDVATVREASLDRRRLAALQEQVEAHEHRVSASRAVVEDPAVVEALAARAPDQAALESTARAARAAADGAHRAEASADATRRQLQRIADLVRTTCDTLGPAVDEAALVRRLADLVTGTSSDNDKRMRLSTYVLAARLERIVALANERLGSMADGRYELVHDDSSARGHRRGGLGLLVRDLWTGRDRPTSTLSGGESFTTSLALALGLADAIREESGGQEFGTLFVDEGFGSLDEDSLEQVLDVLDGLRDGGRAVGLVSHVGEMRMRIPTQVRVDKTQHGSTVHVLDGSEPRAVEPSDHVA